MKKQTILRSFLTLAVTASILMSITACDMTKNYLEHDRETGMAEQDYRDLFAPRQPEKVNALEAAAGIPDFQNYVADEASGLKPMPLVSVSLNEGIPLRDALYEIAAQANYDIELDSRIEGAVIFTATEKPLDMVMERIADLAGLRYSIKDEMMRIELDKPFTKVYKVAFVNLTRDNSSSVSSSISVGGGGGGSTGGGGASGSSSFSVSSSSNSDFWGDFEKNLEQILEMSAKKNLRASEKTPDVTLASGGGTIPSVPAAAVGADPAAVGAAGAAAAPAPVLQVSAIPPSGSGGAGSGGAEGGAGAEEKPSFSINKQASLISVFATEKVHKEVAEYIDAVKKSTMTQVLIEAKVLEVNLEDNYASGIVWDKVLGGDRFSIDFDGPSPGVNAALSSFSVNLKTLGIDPIITAMQNFGTVRALASPRLTVLNNMPAILNVAENTVYFEIEVDREEGQDGDPDQITIESSPQSVPEGVIINVVPSVDTDTQTITMSVRPSITRIRQFKNDPGVALVVQSLDGDLDDENLQSPVPELDVKEIDSVLRMRSGDTLVMGGLLQDRSNSSQDGIPVMAELPMVGNLFKSKLNTISKTEIVIFIKATIVDLSEDTIHQTDRDLYKMLSTDRRPLKL